MIISVALCFALSINADFNSDRFVDSPSAKGHGSKIS